jgi:lysophospholipase L1-like esterase
MNGKWRAALAVAVTVVFTAGLFGGVAAASPAPVTPGSTYLALGDSVVFGYAEPQVVPAPNYHDPASLLGYPELLGAALHLKVANAACPGETSASLINSKARSNGCENSPSGASGAYRAHFPLHVHYKGSQLAYAISYLRAHRDVRLVSLMIGANDLFLCQETTRDVCTGKAELKTLFAKVARNIKTILGAIRNRAHYSGQLVIVNYYSLDYTSAALDNLIITGNKSTDAAAKPFHVSVADGYGQLKAASRRFAGNPCTAGLLNVVGPHKCGVHPTYAGQTLLADAVEKAVAF